MTNTNPSEMEFKKWVYNTLKQMPISKLTRRNCYQWGNQFCFAGYLLHKITGKKIDYRFTESPEFKVYFEHEYIFDELAEAHIEHIVMKKEDKKTVKRVLLAVIKEHWINDSL